MVFKKGQVSLNKGKKMSEEQKLKLSKSHMGKSVPNRGFKGHVPWNKGLTKSDPRVLKYANTKKGKVFSEEHKEKLRESHKGQIPWIKGKHFKHTEDEIRRIKLHHVGMLGKHHTKETILKFSGEKNFNWKGGIAHLPYTVDWTKTLKQSIRERDKYTCRMCGIPQTERVHAVHHIDYKKENCDPNNLITLCVICHPKTNNNREKWIEYFKNLNL